MYIPNAWRMEDAKHKQGIRAIHSTLGKTKKSGMVKQHAQKEDKIYAVYGLFKSNSK